MQKTQPRYDMPSRHHFRYKQHPQLLEKVKEKLKTALSGVKMVSLTADCWTADNSDPFMAITAHWVDNNFTPLQVSLSASYLPGNLHIFLFYS
jgi:hypothetical protein